MVVDVHVEGGLIPVVVQDRRSKDVLMVAYANRESLELTRSTGYAHYYSRSRRRIWKKGEESGNVQRVVRIMVDCDGDALLFQVEQQGPACHTGYATCFYRTLDNEIVASRLANPEDLYPNKAE